MSTSNTSIPTVLGRKVVGEERAAAALDAVLRPQLGKLARGVSDRSGNPLVEDAAPAARGPRLEEADDSDAAELNGQSPAPELTPAATPEAEAAKAALDQVADKKVKGK